MSVKILRELDPEVIKQAIMNHHSKAKALKSLGSSRRNSQALDYLNKFITENNLDVSHHKMGVPVAGRYTRTTIQHYVNQSACWADLMRLMGLKAAGSNIKTARKLINEYEIDTSHFNKGIKKPKRRKLSNAEIFSKNSTAHRANVKRRIILDSIIEYKCIRCGNDGQWMGETLVLQLEHINGINNDNRLDNLCFLCPNCHTQTPTYAGKSSHNSSMEKQ